MTYRMVKTMILLSAAAGVPLTAGTFSFAGTLSGRDDIALVAFTLNADAALTLRTFSYAGGQNAAGDLISDGGFDPAVTIFMADGPKFLVTLDDAEHCGGLFVAADPSTGLCLDSEQVDVPLPAGRYVAALTQSDHLPVGPALSDGFTPGTVFGPSEFVDFTGSVRTGNWELDVIGADSAAVVPEPGTCGLVAMAALLMWRARAAVGSRR
jgi:hypothetical protein